MPNLSRHVLLRLSTRLSKPPRGRRRGLVRAAAMAAAPAALILVAGAGAAAAGPAGGAGGTSPFPGHTGTARAASPAGAAGTARGGPRHDWPWEPGPSHNGAA